MNRKKVKKSTGGTKSKLETVKKSQLIPTKQNKFLDGETRDKFGRNRKYV